MGKSLAEPSPTSGLLHGHLLCLHYFMFLSTNFLIGSTVSIDVCPCRWERISSVLFPNKYLLNMPHGYYITRGCSGRSGNCGCCSMYVLCTEYCKRGNNCKNITKWNYFVFSLFMAETHLVQDLTGPNMELFVKLLTNFKKNSILNVLGVLHPLLHRIYFTHKRTTLFFLSTIFVRNQRLNCQV